MNLLDLQPTVVSKDLKGKFVEIYGREKVGKTTLATQFPHNIIAGFEHGTNAISGAYIQDILKWSDFKAFIKELKKPEVKEKFWTVTIDTAGVAWDQCVAYICLQEGVDKIGDIPYGGGYDMAKKEFESCIRLITQLGYGIVIIAHAATRLESDANNNSVEIVYPDIPKRPREIINRLVDMIAYLGQDENGERWIYTRQTATITAGSRFSNIAPKIPLSYEALVDAISEAITKSEKEDGMVTTDAPVTIPTEGPKADFGETMSAIKACAVALHNAEKMTQYNKIVAEYLGKGKNVKDCTEDQIDIMLLILDDLKDYIAENNIPME